jgi:Fic family protein
MKTDILTRKWKQLQALRPLPRALAANLDEWFRVELTYTSNAIEGNTLTRAETAAVLEKGITVSGKSLRDHLEATNHAAAFDWIKGLAKKKSRQIDEKIILEIHRLILKSIDDENAGSYRRVSVRIAGSTVILPNPAKVPTLMTEFCRWLGKKSKQHPAERAAEAHYRLVTIHPFVDGNGRTARLLMNLILMQSGYPLAIVRPEDRLAYIDALEQAQTGGTIDAYEALIARAMERSLDFCLKTAHGEEARIASTIRQRNLMKIGELAKRTDETAATLRFWIKEGLLEPAQRTKSGYQMFDISSVERVKRIRKLQEKRLSISEIKKKFLGKANTISSRSAKTPAAKRKKPKNLA